ncbi:hypothetical protein FNF27_01248 [Cafeteria roenbergensis]|uniref:RRM domain-containing protein n=2 Tax=Cafeteria roenbergensis TaxID=33653 RepID=A0A5A8DJ65_CAFRO|nr:hypothetical protein FNF31_04697 [Cafeteria roenbergensis]KAA0163881.1 hypothetical protein FNF28_04075 [Cafeteria roenbergensis]KAA0177471.1 hypothetical protein FNF27_01248 [Cafeteria roenbergensis]
MADASPPRRDEDRAAASRHGDDDDAYRSRRERRRDHRSPSGSPGGYQYRDRRGREPERRRSPSRSRSRSRSADSFYERRRARRRRFKSQWDVKPDAATLVAVASVPGMMGGSAPIASQATRHARRLYVGGLQPPIREEKLEAFFTAIVRERIQFVHSPLPPTARPVMSCYVNEERKFAFVEFATLELTAAMLPLDGIDYEGLPLRIKRPNDYDPASLPADTRDRSEVLIVEGLSIPAAATGSKMIGGSGGGVRTRDRIFVGGLPPAVDDKSLGDIFSAFGELSSVHIVRDAAGSSKGFGFVEFVNSDLVDSVCAQLNNIEIAGRHITVNRANSDAGGSSSAASSGMPSHGAAMATHNPLTAFASGIVPGSAMGTPVMGPTPGAQHTARSVVCLEGVATPADTASAPALADLVGALADELSRFGQLHLIVVPKAPQKGEGRALVQFVDAGAAATAASALHGRTFGAASVKSAVYDTAAFVAGEFDRPLATA